MSVEQINASSIVQLKIEKTLDKLIVIDYFATWFGGSVEVLADLHNIADKYKEYIAVVRVDIDLVPTLCSDISIMFYWQGQNIGKIDSYHPELIETVLHRILTQKMPFAAIPATAFKNFGFFQSGPFDFPMSPPLPIDIPTPSKPVYEPQLSDVDPNEDKEADRLETLTRHELKRDIEETMLRFRPKYAKATTVTLAPSSNYRLTTSVNPTMSEGVYVAIDLSNILCGNKNVKIMSKIQVYAFLDILEQRRPLKLGYVGASHAREQDHNHMYRFYSARKYLVNSRERNQEGKEHGVDDMIVTTILNMVDKEEDKGSNPAKQTLVLASGDGNDNDDRYSLYKAAAYALKSGWKVELYSWKASLSRKYVTLFQKYKGRFQIHLLDKIWMQL